MYWCCQYIFQKSNVLPWSARQYFITFSLKYSVLWAQTEEICFFVDNTENFGSLGSAIYKIFSLEGKLRYLYQIIFCKIVLVMYCQYSFLEVMKWYWYYIIGDVMFNVMQYL